MSGSKYTPGPWHVDVDGAVCAESRADVYRRGVIADPHLPHIDAAAGAERAANAQLIAAAPDLFEALEMVRDADEDCKRDGLPTIPSPARRKIDAALAMARGES